MANVNLISILFGLAFLVVIVSLVARNKLMEKYSLLWILFGTVLPILSSTPYFMEKIARILGVVYAPSVLFLFGLVYLIIYNLHITVVFSKQAQKITRLDQKIAILKEMIENKSHGDENEFRSAAKN